MAQQEKPTSADFLNYDPLVFTQKEQLHRSEQFYNFMDKRRSLRHFSPREVPDEVIKNIIKTASTAPSGAHKQPWTFVIVKSSKVKKNIREAAEKEEYENYHGRMGDEWLEDLEKFSTNWQKPFLEVAPILIVVFKKSYDIIEGKKKKNYYVNESVGLACGFLLAAIHQAGLVSLTHTPSPLNFLSKILDRPREEKPFLLIPVGYPQDKAKVPNLNRKSLEEISAWF